MENQCEQCASVLRQTGAAIGVEPGAAVRHLIADRDACAKEREAALLSLVGLVEPLERVDAIACGAIEGEDRIDWEAVHEALWPVLRALTNLPTNLRTQVRAEIRRKVLLETAEAAAEVFGDANYSTWLRELAVKP